MRAHVCVSVCACAYHVNDHIYKVPILRTRDGVLDDTSRTKFCGLALKAAGLGLVLEARFAAK